MSFPSLPAKLELVVLLVGVAAGYNLTLQILPRERIDLAQLETDEQLSGGSSSQQIPAPVEISASGPLADPEPAFESSSAGSCLVPPDGGPALNERFEPC